MARKDPRMLKDYEREYYLDLLWSSVAELNSKQEIKNFFSDLLSESEAIMLARRISIAHLLLEGETYDAIEVNLKTSAATIARVDRWLTSGFGGYEKTLKRLERERERKAESKKVKSKEVKEPYSYEWLKEKYPLHFTLFNLLDKK